MAQPTRLETTMRTLFLPKFTDQVFSVSYLLERFRAKNKVQTGGTGFNKKLVIAKNPNTGTYEPYGTYRANPLDKVTYATVGWKHYYQNIPISQIELLMNKGREGVTKITDILQDEFENAESALKDIYASDVYGDGSEYAYPDGSADSIGPVYGLAYWISKTREAGGITSTSSANLWWDSYVEDLGGVTFANLVDSTHADYIVKILRRGIGETTVGSETPTVIIVPRIIWETLAWVADGKEKFEKMRVGKGALSPATDTYMGWGAFNFDNIPVIWDAFCPGGYIWFVNENFWEVRSLGGANMDIGALESISGGDTKQATIKHSWNIMCHKPQRQGLIYGGPTTR